MNRPPLRRGLLLIAFAGALFALSPPARATCNDGCYPFGNTILGNGANGFYTPGGSNNTTIGVNALGNDINGSNNTAIGYNALQNNMNGNDNTGTGYQALLSNQNGAYNTATGYNALQKNTGSNNTATGASALILNTMGGSNTANGVNALFSNDGGSFNTATGQGALYKNVSGQWNTANGYQALNKNTGNGNTASGYLALYNNTIGNYNIVLGFEAGFGLTTGSNNICIFDFGVAGENNTIRIGTQGTQTTTYVAGISGAMVTGTAVVVNSSGQLGTPPSSARFKEEIKPMDRTSGTILSLKPVTFRYKKQIDAKRTPQFGLVAEDVEKVNPDLVTRDDNGKPYSVRYEAVNAMLLNEFLKEHKKVEEQQATIAELKSTVAQQQKGFESKLAKQEEQIEALAAGLQKVSAQLELSKSAPQTVLNSQ